MAMGGAMDSCGRCMKFSLICINVFTFYWQTKKSRVKKKMSEIKQHRMGTGGGPAKLVSLTPIEQRILSLISKATVFGNTLPITSIGGAIALALGAWVWSSRSFSSTLLNNNMFIASVVVVVATGAVLMLLSLLGCCGAAKEVKCMLLTYYILVFIIFVVMLIGGILQFVFREKVVTTLDRELTAAVPYYGVKHEYTKAWDDTQTYLQCCGVRSYRDWNGNVPESCCKEVYPGKRIDCLYNPNPTNMYMEGCLSKAQGILRENAIYVGLIAIIVAFIMLLGLILSCGLFVKIE